MGADMNDNTVEYRIEGKSSIGWILFGRTLDEKLAKSFFDDWRKARKSMLFRLIKVTTTVSREIVEEDKP